MQDSVWPSPASWPGWLSACLSLPLLVTWPFWPSPDRSGCYVLQALCTCSSAQELFSWCFCTPGFFVSHRIGYASPFREIFGPLILKKCPSTSTLCLIPHSLPSLCLAEALIPCLFICLCHHWLFLLPACQLHFSCSLGTWWLAHRRHSRYLWN